MAGEAVRPLVVAHNFPTPKSPNLGTFVAALVDSWCRLDVPTSVIAPMPIWSGRTRRLEFGLPDTAPGENPQILRPAFASFSNRQLGPLNGVDLTARSSAWAVGRAARRVSNDPTITYGHFLYPAAFAAASVGERLGIPSVAVIGESGNLLDEYASALGAEAVSRTFARFAGVLSVSEPNKQQIVEQFGVDPECVEVVPNATDTARFHPRDRAEMRRKLGLPQDRVLIAFLGWFIERKGPRRVLAALEQLPEVGGLFIGEGPDTVQGPQVLFADRLPHEAVPEYLCAADLFVLPTQFEGSPNAVIEAMACGLPVVTSDIPALRHTVPAGGALLVDPDDVDAIAAAIRSLVEDPQRREAMGRVAFEHASATGIEERAGRIIRWLAKVQAEYAARG